MDDEFSKIDWEKCHLAKIEAKDWGHHFLQTDMDAMTNKTNAIQTLQSRTDHTKFRLFSLFLLPFLYILNYQNLTFLSNSKNYAKPFFEKNAMFRDRNIKYIFIS